MIRTQSGRLYFGVLAFVLLSLAELHSQSSVQPAPADLVKAVVLHELKGSALSDVHWKYVLYKEADGKAETREVVEAKSATVDRLIAVSGRPLTDAEQRAEADRIFNFSHNLEQQRKLEDARRKDSEHRNAFLRMIPDAFLFRYAGESGDQVKVAFKPNPQFRPTSSEAKVLHETEGEVWINTSQQRLVSIDGELTNDVKFGGGLLGHLEKGGRFTVKRAEIAPGQWEATEIIVNMHGKALLFKNISVQQKERHTNFEPVPEDLSISDAAGLLVKESLVALKR